MSNEKWSISPVYLEKIRSRCILSKNYGINDENREIYGQYNFWAPVKSNTSDVWNWNCWTFLIQKLKWGGQWLRPCNDCMNKVKNIDIPNDSVLVTADIVGLYPSISLKIGLKALRNALENRYYEEIPTENLLKIAKIVLRNNCSSTNFGYCYRD